MKVLVTGTTWGIGAAIDAMRPDGAEVIGVARWNGRGLPHHEYLVNMLNALAMHDPDVFVNNAYGDDSNPQLTVFRMVLDRWRSDPSKTIINICSMAARHALAPTDTDPTYRLNKLALLNASEQAAMDSEHVRCRVMAFCPGYVLTHRTSGHAHAKFAMMAPEDAAEYIWWMIRQPSTIRIPQLSVFVVTPEGTQVKRDD